MNRIVLCLFLILFILNCSFALAQERAKYTPVNKSPEETMKYIKKAVSLVQEKGEKSYSELTDPNGPWVDGNWYIYVNDFKGNIVAHLNEKLVGKNMYGVRDVKGNAFYAQLQENARCGKGYGWTEFWWPRPNSIVPAQKLGFVMRVPGINVWVGTGVYDMKQEDIDKVLREQQP